MERLTTDNPRGNLEAILNFAYAENRRVILSYANGEEAVDLCDYVAYLANKRGCDATPESIIEGGCMECDCEAAVLNVLAIQAAELRARLIKYEDAEEQGCLVVLPCKAGDTVFTRNHHGRIVDGVVQSIHQNCVGGKAGRWVVTVYYTEYNGTAESCINPDFWPERRVYGLEHFGKTVFLTHEAAEAAPKGGDE